MNKKSILTEIKIHLIETKVEYDASILDDHVIIIKHIKGFTFRTSIRCQNFGEVYLMNPGIISVRNEEVENQFEKLVFKSLKDLYDSESSLVTSTSNIGISTQILDYQIKFENQLDDFCRIVLSWINEVENAFFEPMKEVKNIATFIAKYPYSDNLKVSVGGKFPVMQLKKMYLLYKGGQIKRYNEYKEGLFSQIESLPERKPQRKEEARIYLNNYSFLVQSLESN